MESKEWKPDSLINVEKMSKYQFDNEKEENPNFKYLDWLTSPLYKLGAEQLNKLQSYIVIQDILDQLTWISSAKLDEEAGKFFAEKIPESTLNEMVLLGLVKQNQDKHGQISYQPSQKTKKERKTIYEELVKRFEYEAPKQGQTTLHVPFDWSFKKQLVKKLEPFYGWLTSNEIIKVMGYDVSLTDEHVENYHTLLDEMVEDDQLEKHKDDMFRLKRE